jgi:tetratricopeptide (TPR) repeat protein
MLYLVWELVDAFIQTGELTDALDVLNQHLNDNPHDAKALEMRGQINLRFGNLEDAIVDFRAIHHPTPDQTIHHAVALKRLGMFGLGLDVLNDALGMWEGEQTADYHRLVDCFVDIAIAQGDDENLKRALDCLAKVTQPSVYVFIRQAELARLLGEYQVAIVYFSDGIDALSPQISPNHYLAPMVSSWLCARAGCYQSLGDGASAIADYLLAEKLMPDDRSIVMNRALLMGDVDLMRSTWANANEKERGVMASITPSYIRDRGD